MAEQLWHVGGPYMLRLELRLGLRLGLEMCGCCGVVVLEAERLWHAREPRALGSEPPPAIVRCVEVGVRCNGWMGELSLRLESCTPELTTPSFSCPLVP